MSGDASLEVRAGHPTFRMSLPQRSMAHLDTNPRTPTGARIDLFADALEREGSARRAAAVRRIALEYRQRLAEGDAFGAAAAFASLAAFRDRPEAVA